MRMWQQDNEQQVLQQNWQGSAGWYDWDLKKKKRCEIYKYYYLVKKLFGI